ncbi:MAG: acetyltransferase [Microscillaceae bacterium]|jgi:acetyltransferase EpsM|nr:acetyltransferase [Microscillaceae bacterium]
MLIYGAGGHAKVVLDYLQTLKIDLAGVFDDDLSKHFFYQYAIRAYDADFLPEVPLLITVGDNFLRRQISQKIKHSLGKLIHPSAIVSPQSRLAVGTVVFAGVIVQSEAQIGKNVILNTTALVEHDCQVADYVHIAPRATLCGAAQVGEGTLIGAGAVVLPQVKVGKWSKIGAGAIVNQDIPDYAIAVGNPAKIIQIQNF